MEGRALINDPMDHFSEGACLQRWLLPDESTGQGPGTPRQRGQKSVTVQGTPSPRLQRPREGMPAPTELSGDGGTCFCRHGINFIEHYACRACPAFANQKRGYKFDRSR
jgi:hypothetical protein